MIKLPKWQTLPTLELYLDQVLIFVNQQLTPLFPQQETILTASMINNYVKQGLIPKPIKKKYNQRHLAYLISITLLKTAFNIHDISSAMQHISAQHGSEQSYNDFVDFVELIFNNQEMTDILPKNQQLIYNACRTVYLHRQSLILLDELINEESYHENI